MEWIVEILKQHGLAGAVIFVLAYIVTVQRADLKDIASERLEEARSLIKALEQNTAAFHDNAKATEARNEVTERLADVIGKHANAFDFFAQKADMRAEAVKDQLDRHTMALQAFAESNRVNTGILTDIRDRVKE